MKIGGPVNQIIPSAGVPFDFPLARGGTLSPCEGVKFFLLSLMVVLLAGCATGPDGERLGPWQTLEKWDQSMMATENRLHNKNYQQ